MTSADLSDIGCLAGCIISFCPATVDDETSVGSTGVGDFNNSGNVSNGTTTIIPSNSASQASAHSCQIGDSSFPSS